MNTSRRFCSNCGAALAPGARFCGACGQPISTPQEEAQPAASGPLSPVGPPAGGYPQPGPQYAPGPPPPPAGYPAATPYGPAQPYPYRPPVQRRKSRWGCCLGCLAVLMVSVLAAGGLILLLLNAPSTNLTLGRRTRVARETVPPSGGTVVVNAPAGYGVAETCNASVSRDVPKIRRLRVFPAMLFGSHDIRQPQVHRWHPTTRLFRPPP